MPQELVEPQQTRLMIHPKRLKYVPTVNIEHNLAAGNILTTAITSTSDIIQITHFVSVIEFAQRK